jgi:hypothetical protein
LQNMLRAPGVNPRKEQSASAIFNFGP